MTGKHLEVGMKKIVAVILMSAFLLSSSACAKKAETTETLVETKKTETTESKNHETSKIESIDEPTEETPASSSEETTIEMTEETTEETSKPTRKGDPNWKPTPLDSISIDASHKNLDISLDPVSHNFSAKDPGTDDEIVRISCEYLKCIVNDKGFEELQKTLDGIVASEGERYEKLYAQKVSELKESFPSAGESLIALFDDAIYIKRADDQIVSFMFSSWENVDYSYNSSEKYYNIESKTGKIISFDDVVKDKDALYNYLESFIYSEDYVSEYDLQRLNETFAMINDGTIDFQINYDGIYFNGYFVSAVNCPECFNMGYFFNVPDSYIISEDESGTISWDINGDGKVETISMGEGSNGSYVDIRGVKTDVQSNSGYHIYLAHTSTGFYMDFGVLCGSDDRCEVIYRINDDWTVDYVTEGCLADWVFDYHPEIMKLESVDQHYSGSSWGITDSRVYYSFTGEPIKADPQDMLFHWAYGPYYLKTNVESKIQNDGGTWNKCTLEKGTAVCVIGYDSTTKELILSDVNLDESENKTYRFSYDANDNSVNGVSVYDVFDTIQVGG
jgi:hypothetical protein